MSNRLGIIAILVGLAVVVAAVPAGALPAMATGASASVTQDGGANASNASNASLGASVSGFMQASAADAEGEVEDGMFNARFDNATANQRADLVRARADTLEQRLDRLREQRAELLNSTDGEEPSVADRAKAARLSARIDALEESINTTSDAAERAGVDLEQLDELRANASGLTGPEVAELARGLAGVDSDRERGASGDRPQQPGGDGQPVAGNATDADGNTTDGAPSSSGNGSGNGGPDTGSDRGNGGNADDARANDGSDTDDTTDA